MNGIETTLTTSGNSTAVRLPKQLLQMSGLGKDVRLEAKKGKIIISSIDKKRVGWDTKIKQLIQEHGDPSAEFTAVSQKTAADGLKDAPWDGPSYEQWKKQLS